MTDKHKSNLENGVLTLDLLIEAAHTIEASIRKCAYNRKKYQYAVGDSSASWNESLKENMKYRTYVNRILINSYNLDEQQIKQKLSQVKKRTIPDGVVHEIIGLIRSGNFQVG